LTNVVRSINFMRSFNKALLVVFVVTTLGLWGCNYSTSSSRSTAARIRHLEYRNAKLEEDYRTAIAECNRLQKEVAAAIKLNKKLGQQQADMQIVLAQRDTLEKKLSVSVGERDALRIQMVHFSKELQSLAGQVEVAAANQPGSVLAKTVSREEEKEASNGE